MCRASVLGSTFESLMFCNWEVESAAKDAQNNPFFEALRWRSSSQSYHKVFFQLERFGGKMLQTNRQQPIPVTPCTTFRYLVASTA